MTGCRQEPHLHVFADRAMWRWSYHEPDGDDGQGLQLQSSIAFADAEEARSSAMSAYPGTAVADDDDEQSDAAPAPEAAKRHRCRRTVPAALVTIVLAATVVVILRRRERPTRPTNAKPLAPKPILRRMRS